MTTINQIKRIWNWDKISAIQFEGKCVESSVPRKKNILCTILNTLTFQRPFIRQILKNTYIVYPQNNGSLKHIKSNYYFM